MARDRRTRIQHIRALTNKHKWIIICDYQTPPCNITGFANTDLHSWIWRASRRVPLVLPIFESPTILERWRRITFRSKAVWNSRKQTTLHYVVKHCQLTIWCKRKARRSGTTYNTSRLCVFSCAPPEATRKARNSRHYTKMKENVHSCTKLCGVKMYLQIHRCKKQRQPQCLRSTRTLTPLLSQPSRELDPVPSV